MCRIHLGNKTNYGANVFNKGLILALFFTKISFFFNYTKSTSWRPASGYPFGKDVNLRLLDVKKNINYAMKFPSHICRHHTFERYNWIYSYLRKRPAERTRIYLYTFASLIRIAKMRIQIRLIENRLQLTKFQIFQRTILDFNGTAMTRNKTDD